MKLLIFASLALLTFMSAEGSSGGFLQLTPCKLNDKVCLISFIRDFIKQTCHGRSDYDLKIIDPLFIDSQDFVVRNNLGTALMLHYKNLNVTGLKNQEISDFEMDPKAKLMVSQTKVDLNIVGDVTVVSRKTKQSFSGSFTLKGTALVTSSYNYIIVTDYAGAKHIEIGPETILCQTLKDPELTLETQLRQVIDREYEIVKEEMELFKSKELRKRIFCEIVQRAYETVVHNYRMGGRILAQTEFLEDL